MATGEGAIYNAYKQAVLSGAAGTTNLKVMLVAGYTPDIDAHADYENVSAYEVSGTGYTAGGKALSNVQVEMDQTANVARLKADAVTWTGLDVGTPSHAILYDIAGTLMCYWELGVASNGNDYTLQFNTQGIIVAQ